MMFQESISDVKAKWDAIAMIGILISFVALMVTFAIAAGWSDFVDGVIRIVEAIKGRDKEIEEAFNRKREEVDKKIKDGARKTSGRII